MALIHQATIRPTKLELLRDWVPTQRWGGPVSSVAGAYRFDDPQGEVGIETILVHTTGGAVLQVPLTYRGGPLSGAEQFLLCTMEHSVLGRRWVYDGCGDPVYVRALAAAVVSATPQAEEIVERDGDQQVREPSVRVASTGTPLRTPPPIDTAVARSEADATVLRAGELELVLRRRLDADPPELGAAPALTGTWGGRAEPAVLAYAPRL